MAGYVYEELIQSHPQIRLLDYGSGTGNLLLALTRHDPEKNHIFSGVENNNEARNVANTKLSQKKVFPHLMVIQLFHLEAKTQPSMQLDQ